MTSHLKITQAGLTALLVAVIGQVAAFVPNIATQQETLISAGSTLIAVAFLIANAVHALAGAQSVQGGLSPAEVQPVVSGELRRLLTAGAASQAPPVPAPAPAPPPAPLPAVPPQP